MPCQDPGLETSTESQDTEPYTSCFIHLVKSRGGRGEREQRKVRSNCVALAQMGVWPEWWSDYTS